MQGFGGDYNAGRLWMAGVLPLASKSRFLASLGMTRVKSSSLRSE